MLTEPSAMPDDQPSPSLAPVPLDGASLSELEAFVRRASLLQRLQTHLGMAMHAEQVADEVAARGREIFGASASLVYVRQAEELVLIGHGGVDAARVEGYRRVPLESRVPLALAVQRREPAWFGERGELLAAHPELADVRENGEPLQGMVLLPLVAPDGTLLGALAFSFYQPQRIDPLRRELFLMFASHCAQALVRARVHERAEQANAELRAQQHRLELLARVSDVLSSTLDSREALQRLVHMVVPAIADWCAIDELVDGEIRRIAVHHTDPAKVQLAAQLLEEYPPAIDAPHGVPRVLRTGEPEWVPHIPDELLAQLAQDERQLEISRSLGLTSYACVPIAVRGKVLGVLTLVHAESGRRFSAEDVAHAHDLARRAALALENARLYESVSRNEARMRALVEATAAVVWNARPDGQVVEISPSWLAFTGQTEAEYVNGGFLEAIHPDDRAPTMAIWAASVGARQPYAAEYRLRRGDGSYAHTLARGMPVFDRTGAVLEYIGCNVDITGLREAERVARRHAETLGILNEVGRLISAELDRDKMVQALTDAATALSGAQFGAFFHNVVDDEGARYMLYALSGAPRERFSSLAMPRNTALFAPTFAGEGVVRVDDVLEDPRYGRNAPHRGMPEGHLPVRSYLAAPVVSRSGEVLGGLFLGHGRVGVFDERTETVIVGLAAQAAVAMDNARLFGESQRLIAALEASNRDLDQFAYVTSHDLKAPLRGIANLAQWLEEDLGPALNDDTRRKMSLLRGRVVRMEALIQGILDYSRAGRSRQSQELVDVRKLIAEIVDLIAPDPRASVVCEGELPVLRTERVALQQVLQNLVANALKHSGRPDVTITVTSTENPDDWELTVRDDGVGIAPEFHERIWGIFQTLEARDKLESTGIGLAIVKRIVQNRGGRVGLQSTPGHGTMFSFTWPKHERRT